MKRVLLLLVLASSAHANPDPTTKARAASLFEKGLAHYQAGEYQASIELFQSAYELVHDPVYLFNIAQAYRKVADCLAAYDFYLKYLDQAKDAPNRDKVQGWLRELQPCVDRSRAEHEAAEKAAAAERERLAQEAARKQEVVVPSHTERVDHGRTLRLAGLGAAGAGVVGLAVGVGYALHGASLKDQVARDCASGCDWNAELPTDRAGNRANTIAEVALIGGGLAAIAGAGLYYLGMTKVEVVQVPGGVVVGTHVSF
jgi:tetratricopeptide (TPR) repeat protein